MPVPNEQTKKGGPPEDIDASDLWLALQALPRPVRNVPIPRKLPGTDVAVGEVAIWPLSQDEHHQANAAADRFTKELLKDPQKKDEANIGYTNLFANELAVQQLWRACRDPNKLERHAFPSPKALRLTLTNDEVGVLYNHFLTAQSELGPIIATMDEEEYEAWVRRLAEGGKAFPFDLLSWDLRIHLVRTMARQIVDSWTATSSAGAQPGESTSTSSNDDASQPSTSSDSETSSDGSSSDSKSDSAQPPEVDAVAVPDPDTGK